MPPGHADDPTFQRAMAALQAGNTKDAEQLLKALLRAQPRHVAALNVLAIALTQQRQFSEAETYLRQALRENARSDATLYNYGLVLKALLQPGGKRAHSPVDERLVKLARRPRLPDPSPAAWTSGQGEKAVQSRVPSK